MKHGMKWMVIGVMALGMMGVARADEGAPAGGPAGGSVGQGNGEHGGACRGDIEKFCKDVQAGEGRIVKCLKAHESELSDACKEQRAKIKESMKEAHKACEDDVQKFCADVQKGGGRIIDCLKQHQSELSSGCQAKMAAGGRRGQRRGQGQKS